MNDDLNISLSPGEPPDAELLKRITVQMESAPAVRPLPSNAILLTISLSLFAIISFALAAVVKFKAFAALSAGEMALYYGAIGLCALLFGRAVVERMIPGEKRLIRSFVLWIAALAVLGVVMGILFSDHSTVGFVASGVPCLTTGAISALVSGVLGWRLLRRGYLVNPRETILLYGFFAGLVGIAVLALHCPIRNSLHFLVWHLGAMILAGIAGLLVGNYIENAD